MGKYSVIMVFTLSVMLALLLPNIYRLGFFSSQNYLNYAIHAQSHNIAASGANVALSKFYFDTSWRAGLSKLSLSGGTYSVTVQNYGSNQLKFTSVGTYADSVDTVTVIVQPGSFASYAYYSKVEGGITWVTGDTVWGPFHTQDVMNISGSPVFKGRVSAYKGTNPKTSSAKFLGGYITNESIDLPLNFSDAQTAATSGGKQFASGDVWLTFNGTSVTWKTSLNGTSTTSPLSTFAPNGVISTAKGNMHIQGTLDARITLCAQGTGTTGGNVYIDNDIKYTHDPRTGTSTDMLGILADNNVIITDNAANNSSVIIQASMLCRTGGMTAENYASRGVAGTLSLLGGIIQYQRGAVGTFSGSGGNTVITSGYVKDYRYDTRLATTWPPYFPFTGKYQLISWIE
jgi:hypothetical protein